MKTKNITIGLFVVGGLALFGAGMFLIGDQHQVFARHNEYYSDFVNLAGLSKGAKVRVAGMQAGQVLDIAVPDSPSSRFRVKWRIDAKLRGLVRTDSIATIGTEGVVGGTYLSVGSGSSRGQEAAPFATIPSREPAELMALLNDAQGTLKDVSAKLGVTLDGLTTTVANVNDVVVGLKEGRGTAGMLLRDDAVANQIRQSITSVTAAASGMNDIVAGVKEGRGPAGMLLQDEALAGQIRDAVSNAQKATANLNHASHQADALVSDLNSRQIPEKTGELMTNLGDSARQLHQVMSDIAKPDERGMSAGENIRESLMNANMATSNLAEGTEALKHNFFLRGFFKKRGYYSLANILPEKYRSDRVFASPTNHRAWLTGSELFQAAVNGKEELSARGKAALDSAFTEYRDSVIESPIVIEGYSTSDLPADQLRISRSRAMLVRQYLQTRFELDTNNLGAVAMRNAPPRGLERQNWDGICIVVLNGS